MATAKGILSFMCFQTNGIGKVHIIWKEDERILRRALYKRVFGVGCSAKMIRSPRGGVGVGA